MLRGVYTVLILLLVQPVFSQVVPVKNNHADFLIVFGPDSRTGAGDDDHSQVVFFQVPTSYDKPVYFRVFDPEIGGVFDVMNGEADSEATYSVYGGKGAFSNPEARSTNPAGNYKSGELLGTKTFLSDDEYDGKWFSIGPFSPTEGEVDEAEEFYTFKVIIEGTKGNEGNAYKLYMSGDWVGNFQIEGSRSFAYEYSLRRNDKVDGLTSIYPLVPENTASITVKNYDFNEDGFLQLYSLVRNGHFVDISGDRSWAKTTFELNTKYEYNFLHLRTVKKKSGANDVVISVVDQDGMALPLYTRPFDEVPKYLYKFSINYN